MNKSKVQFSSVTQSCPTLCNPINHSTPGLPVITNSQSPRKPMSIESVMPSNNLIPVIPFFSCPQSFPASGSFQISQFFASGGQSIGVSTSKSVLPRSKRLLISRLQSLSAVILEPKKIKAITVSNVSPLILP